MPTKISWSDETWNFVTGCSKVSEGCRHCYAERIALRSGASSLPWTQPYAHLNVQFHPERLSRPYAWKSSKRCFVNSISDLFHERVEDDWITQGWTVMASCPQHVFQILTKRPIRMAAWPGPWLPNIWAGVSVESRKHLDRLDSLRKCGALLKFVSFEPLLEDLGPTNLDGLGWIIVGGESGADFRPMDHAWARHIRDQATLRGIPFFFKQSASFFSETGKTLIETDGRRTTWEQYPELPEPKPTFMQPRLL